MLIPGLHGPIISWHNYIPLAQQLTSRGFDLILVQMRSALDWGNAVFEDSLLDLRGAIEYAKDQGIQSLSLFGTSLGGTRVMYYHAQGRDPIVRSTGFLASLASPYLSEKQRVKDNKEIDAVLAQARKLITEGRGHEPVRMEWLPGRGIIQSARSFVSFFGTLDESNCSTVKWGHTVKVPALVLHGTEDEAAPPSNAEAIYSSLTNAPTRDLMWLEGARHYLEEGWIARGFASMIAEWVDQKMPG